jgi:HSP20 family molecular chaperone IbpA
MNLNDYGISNFEYPQSSNLLDCDLINLNYNTPIPIYSNPNIICDITSNINCDITPNIDVSDIILVKEEEKYLKYNKYVYEYSMSNSNSNTTPNIEGINNIASLGINLVGSFIDTATPIVKDLSEKMKEFETKINDDFNNSKRETSTKNELVSYSHEDDTNLYFVVELPRVRKEDCEVKYLKNDNILLVCAKTEVLKDGFSFMENKELEIKLNIPTKLNITSDNIVVKHRNGVLYVSISKCLINLNNININILD